MCLDEIFMTSWRTFARETAGKNLSFLQTRGVKLELREASHLLKTLWRNRSICKLLLISGSPFTGRWSILVALVTPWCIVTLFIVDVSHL